jgi:plastocyanin
VQRRSILGMILVPVTFLLMALAVPSLVAAGGGCHGPATAPGDGESSVVKIDGCMFFPTVVRVPVGTTVRFLNTGDAPHNVTGVAGTWASDILEPGAEYQQAFRAPGVYPFACTLHPGMNGAVVIGEAQAAAAPALATATQPAEAAAPATDPISLAIVGLAGLGIGLGIGAVASRGLRRPAA